MFGYVKPYVPYLYVKDETLFNSLYCQVCKSIGGKCGQCARFSLTYDIAFMSAIVHNVTGVDVKIKRERCVAHPFFGRPIAARDEISDALGALNVILAYYKLTDDVADEGKHRVARAFLKGGFRRAARRHPRFAEIVSSNYEKLREIESAGDKSIDETADPFAVMLAQLSAELLGKFSDEFSYKFFYNLGKWIYLIDALDDYDKDVTKGRYNPFASVYKSKDFDALRKDNGEEISFILSATLAAIAEGLSGLKFRFNADLVKNVALRGTTERTKKILSGDKSKEEQINRRR